MVAVIVNNFSQLALTLAGISLSITVAGSFLTKKASLILYVLRTCPVQIRPGKRHEAAIYRGSRSPKYLQIELRNCNAKAKAQDAYETTLSKRYDVYKQLLNADEPSGRAGPD